MQTDTGRPQVTSPIIVFGRDDKGKPHASRFEAADAPLAERAAGLMGMQVLRVGSDELEALAAKLPSGRIFASGKGFVPFVKAELFARLDGLPEAFSPACPFDAPPERPSGRKGRHRAASANQPVTSPPELPDAPVGTPPADWADIKLGSLVLAAEENTPGIWYVATVIAERDEDLFELRWHDWPDEPVIARRREHLGLFPSAVIEALA